MNQLLLNDPDQPITDARAQLFTQKFMESSRHSKYIFGRNIYTKNIIKHIKVDGIIDDFTKEQSYNGIPIIESSNIPADALVVVAAGGRPLTANRQLEQRGINHLDYFAFYKFSGLPLTDVIFNEGFCVDFEENEEKYKWIYDLLRDDLSRSTFRKLISFRFDYNINHLTGFMSREKEQYFENFLHLQSTGESFIDVGGYNGFNSLEFIKRCPGYNSVHIFEPEKTNSELCRAALAYHPNTHCYQLGLSDKKQTLKFEPQGSGSTISESGTVTIDVDRLDDVIDANATPSLIKMDIEGAELSAIEGAVNTIKNHHPRLAICVYHRAGDFWRIPQKILSIRNDYEIYLRHYTESIYETVMFFLPASHEKKPRT